MKLIKITKGKFAKVDDEDFEYLNQWSWYYSTNGYAKRSGIAAGGIRYSFFMHRLINDTPDGKDTHHKNEDKLDNRRENLETVSRGLNVLLNSKHYGIYYHKDRPCKPWIARVIYKKKNYLNRGFKTEGEAKQARRLAIKEIYNG